VERPEGPLKGRPRKGAGEGRPCSKAVGEMEGWERRAGEWVAKAVRRAAWVEKGAMAGELLRRWVPRG